MWLKLFRRKKLQSALIFLIITLCTLLITGSVVTITSLSAPYHELKNEVMCPDVKIYPTTPGAISGKDWKGFLEKLDGVEKVRQLESYVTTSVFIGGDKKAVFIDVVKYDDAYNNVRIIDGSLSELQTGTCAVPSAFANEHGIKIGDTIGVPNGTEKVEYKVVAIFADIYSMSIAFTSDLLVMEHEEGMQLREVYATYFKDGYTYDQFVDDYTANNEGVIDGYFSNTESCIGNAAMTESIMGGILLGISMVIFFVILLIISYIIKNGIRKDKKNIAIYKALGFTEGKIARVYTTFYQSIIFVGSVIGAFSSVIVSLAFMKAAYKNLGIENTSADIWQKLICIGVINLVTFIMICREFSRLKSVKPVEILTDNEKHLGKKKYRENKKSVFNYSPLAMALRSFTREKKRAIVIIITSVMSIYIVNIAIVCLQNIELIKGETNYFWLGIDDHDVNIDSICDKEKFYELVDEVAKDEDVEKIYKKNYGITFAIPYHESVGAATYETFDGVECDLIKGRNPETTGEVAVGNMYLNKLGIEIGDYIDISFGGGKTARLLVVGSYQGFFEMGKSIRILGGLLDENDVYYKYDAASIILKDGVDRADFVKKIEEKYGDLVTAVDRRDLYGNIMNMICEPQRTALLPFVIITIIIGVVNLFYIIYSNNCDNRKKNTIMKSLGYSAGHLLKSNLIFTAIIAAASIAVSIPLLIFVFPKLMVLAMSSFGFAKYELTVYPLTLVLINGGMFILFMLTTLATGRELYKNHLNYIVNE